MLPASRSGKISTFARPATAPTSFSFFAATAGTSAASACSSPSIASDGARPRASSTACATLSTCACWRCPWSRTTAARPAAPRPAARRQVCADASAMSASCSADRVGIHRAVGVDEHAIRKHHQEEARRRRDAGGEPDRHHCRLDHARRRMRGTGHHRVGIAGLHHQAGMKERLGGEAQRHLRIGLRTALPVERRIASPADRPPRGRSSTIGSARPSSRNRRAAATIRSSSPSGNTTRRPRPRIRAKQASRMLIATAGRQQRRPCLSSCSSRGWRRSIAPSAHGCGTPRGTRPRPRCRRRS